MEKENRSPCARCGNTLGDNDIVLCLKCEKLSDIAFEQRSQTHLRKDQQPWRTF